ncbi:protein Brevis radix-like 1 [Dioscorea cayenensis subsp. rotundata]|uniref:Protein Brevis radix-like 1 n=1 Tax=Dioscorea cayennensis subsp. rotundata TaxID=55577 RepID=A0AB40CQG5_DIOCR|nr:protein Brevis radix-like 1 [Dioscorea cayenensis subsp. rotundata]
MSMKAMKVQHNNKEEKSKSSSEVVEVLEAKREEEWIAEAEPGVYITLVALPNGANLLKKIRFREEMFDAWEAQKWWRDNCDKIMALHSVISHQESLYMLEKDQTQIFCILPAFCICKSPIDSTASQESQECEEEQESITSCNSNNSKHQENEEGESSRKCSNEGMERKVMEWVVEDEPGVFVTIRSLPDGSKELRRVELSRERFGEVKARVWWEENKARLHRQYS